MNVGVEPFSNATIGCTHRELREEKLRLERLKHLTQAEEIREPGRSTYGSAWGGIEVNELYAFNAKELLPEDQETFDEFRNHVAADYANAISAADKVKARFEKLKKKAEDAEDTEDD